MENLKYKTGQTINFINGSLNVQTGKIVKVKENTLIVIDSDAGLQLWNLGFAVGSEIFLNQIKND